MAGRSMSGSVLFDLDGTLVDSPPAGRASLRVAAPELGPRDRLDTVPASWARCPS